MKRMMGQLDAALMESPPDCAKISQLKRSLEVQDTLKVLDSDILNYIDDEAELAEQADDLLFTWVYSMLPSSRPRRVLPGFLARL